MDNNNKVTVKSPIKKSLFILWFTISGAILVTIAFIINYIQGAIIIKTPIDIIAVLTVWLILTGVFPAAALINTYTHKERFK